MHVLLWICLCPSRTNITTTETSEWTTPPAMIVQYKIDPKEIRKYGNDASKKEIIIIHDRTTEKMTKILIKNKIAIVDDDNQTHISIETSRNHVLKLYFHVLAERNLWINFINNYTVDMEDIYFIQNSKWGLARLLWIGFIKNGDNRQCKIALLPKDVVEYIISFL